MSRSELFIQAQKSILEELRPVFSEDEFERILKYFTLGIQAGVAATIIDEMDLYKTKKEAKDV